MTAFVGDYLMMWY